MPTIPWHRSVSPSRLAMFGWEHEAAQAIAQAVGLQVRQGRDLAVGMGIPKPQIERLASAFEHDELKKALAAQLARRRWRLVALRAQGGGDGHPEPIIGLELIAQRRGGTP